MYDNFGITPRRYQRRAKGYWNQYGLMGNQMRRIGGQEQQYGLNQMATWQPKANSMFGLASGIASREPTWYADRAGVTSNQAFDESKGVQERALSRMGINPNSGRFVGLQTQWGLARAAAEAGARTKAAQDATDSAFQKQAQLLGHAQQGMQQGAGMLDRAGLQYGRAGQVYDELGGVYDRLAGESQENETIKAGQTTGGSSDLWERMLNPVPYGQVDPNTGQIRMHPNTSRQYAGLQV